MKKLLLLLLLLTQYTFSQQIESVQKGYFRAKVGDSILPNRTTERKAKDDGINYCLANDIDSYVILFPDYVEVAITGVVPKVINDTIAIKDTEILVVNAYMGVDLKDLAIDYNSLYPNPVAIIQTDSLGLEIDRFLFEKTFSLSNDGDIRLKTTEECSQCTSFDFKLETGGLVVHERTEKVKPYSVNGDTNLIPEPYPFTVGNYNLTTSGKDSSGNVLITSVLKIKII